MELNSKQLAASHNELHDVNLYSEILNLYPEHANRTKCKCCGGEIYYSNTWLKSHKDNTISPMSTSYMSVKNMYGVIYHLHICEKCMLEKFPELAEKNMGRIYNMPNKYTQYAFDIPEDDIKRKTNELCVRSLESFTRKYGDEEGKRRWDSYIEKQRVTNTFEYKRDIHGYSQEDFDAYNRNRACTLNNMIKRHGLIEGTKKWEDYRYKQMYTTTLEYFVEKYGEEKGRAKWDNFNHARLAEKSYSYISQELFNEIMRCPDMYGDEIYYMTYNREYCVHVKDFKKIYYLDFYDKTLGLCIEFNGNKFHPKPGEYKEGDLFTNIYEGTSLPVEHYWNKEQERIRILKDICGIETIIVWEDEYKKNKKYIISKLKHIIDEKRKRKIEQHD